MMDKKVMDAAAAAAASWVMIQPASFT